MALSLRFSLINSSHNKRFSIFLWRKNNWKLKQKAEKEKQSAEREPQKKQWLSNSVFSPLNLQSCHLLLSSKSPLSDLPSSSWLPPSALPLSESLFPEPFIFFFFLNNQWIFVLFLVLELFLDLGFCFYILFLGFECANDWSLNCVKWVFFFLSSKGFYIFVWYSSIALLCCYLANSNSIILLSYSNSKFSLLPRWRYIFD